MENILVGFVILVGVIVISSIINEKKLHLPHDIALLIFSSILGFLLLIGNKVGIFSGLINVVSNFKFDNFLLECSLGFIMFASASKMKFNKFVKNIVPISYLSVITTVVSSLIYGGILYLICILLGLDISIWICFLLGSIIALTDPLPATGILGKAGASKSMLSVIEGESLLNDGAALALFVFFKGMIETGVAENFLILVLKEILGALAVGFAISFVLFKLVKITNEPIMHILISLLTVSLSYVICEYFGFSAVIASVVCGMYFSYQMDKISRWKEVVDSKELYEDFWHIIGNLLNSILYVLVGLSIASIDFAPYVLLLIPLVILLNLFSRFIGVLVSAMLLKKKKIPGKYNVKEFVTLLTWTGLRGGVSLALALTVKDIIPSEAYLVLLNSTIITILFTTIVQGLTSKKVYNYIEKTKEKRIEEIS